MTHLRHLLLPALALATGLQPAHALVLAGSDLLDAGVREAIAGELKAAGVEATLAFEGSLRGGNALADGTADAAILAEPDSGGATSGLRAFPFAFQIVTFLVHASNPVMELDYSQLAGLFAAGGTLADWVALTPNPDWANRKIALWAARSQSTITLEIFDALVLKGSSLRQEVRYSEGGAAALLGIVTENPAALVVAPAISQRNPAVRALAVKASATQQAYTPSPDNVLYGDYPLRLPFQLVVGADVSDAVLSKLLQALYSPAVTAALEAMNCLPVPESERRAILNQYD